MRLQHSLLIIQILSSTTLCDARVSGDNLIVHLQEPKLDNLDELFIEDTGAFGRVLGESYKPSTSAAPATDSPTVKSKSTKQSRKNGKREGKGSKKSNSKSGGRGETGKSSGKGHSNPSSNKGDNSGKKKQGKIKGKRSSPPNSSSKNRRSKKITKKSSERSKSSLAKSGENRQERKQKERLFQGGKRRRGIFRRMNIQNMRVRRLRISAGHRNQS